MGANTSSASCTSSSLGHSSAPTTPTTPEAAAIPLLPTSPVPLSSHSHHRRSFRSLLRSMSATHHHGSAVYQLQHQLLLLGEPRPSDMAPESCLSPHHPSSTSPSIKEGLHHQHRRNQSHKSLKSPKSSMELLNSDMVYCPGSNTPSPALSTLPATTVSEELLSESPEEVFLGSEDVRYYNLTAAMTIPLPGSNGNGGRRRHSIGTFLSKDRSTYSSVIKTPATATAAAAATDGQVAPAVNDDAMQKMSVASKTGRVQDVTPPVGTGGSSTPDWRHPAATPLRMAKEVPRSAHSRRRCNRCCKTKGKCKVQTWVCRHKNSTDLGSGGAGGEGGIPLSRVTFKENIRLKCSRISCLRVSALYFLFNVGRAVRKLGIGFILN